MGIQNQTKIKSWDEAFRRLLPVIRQESVRVADYTQILFAKACTMPCYTKSSESPACLSEEYVDVAYKCGLYHQIGKALQPEENQIWRDDFTEEEKHDYYAYTTEGRELVARLHGDADDDDDENTPVSFLMVREACEQHLERWDGTGFPRGRQREEISFIAQVVSLAKELDRLVCTTRSENPFEEAMGELMYRKGTWFSANLIDTMRECHGQLRETYKKYIHYTRTIYRPVPLVEMRSERPFGLQYRAVQLNGAPSQMYEAVPWFKGVAEDEGLQVTMKHVETPLQRIGLLRDVSMYLLYEAADTVLRLENWDAAPQQGLIVHMSTLFYSDSGARDVLEKLFVDQPIMKKHLRLTVSSRFLDAAEPFLEMGIPFLLNGYRPQQMAPSQLLEAGFDFVRISKKIRDSAERAALTEELQHYGVTVVESDETMPLLSEDEWIRQL